MPGVHWKTECAWWFLQTMDWWEFYGPRRPYKVDWLERFFRRSPCRACLWGSVVYTPLLPRRTPCRCNAGRSVTACEIPTQTPKKVFHEPPPLTWDVKSKLLSDAVTEAITLTTCLRCNDARFGICQDTVRVGSDGMPRSSEAPRASRLHCMPVTPAARRSNQAEVGSLAAH